MSGHRSTRLTKWVKDSQGQLRPVPTYESAYNIEDMKALQIAAGSNKYDIQRDADGNPAPGEAKYDGMTCYEVAQDRRAQAMARGDLVALNQYEDRVLGKPKQEVHQTTVSLSFSEIAAQRIAEGALNFKTVRDTLIEEGVIVEVVQDKKQSVYDDLGF